MHMYVLATVPRPRQTERTFWALSAMPATNRKRRFTTLSINKMETVFLVDFGDGKRGEGPVGGCINVSASAVAANYGEDAVAKNFPALSVDPHRTRLRVVMLLPSSAASWDRSSRY